MLKSLLKIDTQNAWKELAFVISGTVLLAVASKIFIPLKPVPITLQPTAVLLLALTYTQRRAFQSVLLWIGMGAAGLPVFATANIGLPIGPTAGYIYSYLLITALIPYLREKIAVKSWFADMGLCLIATLINFGLGISWLSTFIGFEKAIEMGLLPFIIPGIIKAGLLCGALKALRAYKSE